MNLNAKSTKLLITAASFFALAASANATDIFDKRNDALADPAPAAQAQTSWSGVWIGALGGYQFNNSGFDYDSVQSWGATEIGTIHGADGLAVDGLASDGFFGELQLGYDQQVSSNFVIGAFGGYNLTNSDPATATVHASVPFYGLDINETVSVEQEWGGVLGARVGVLKSPDTMFYAAGGWAFGELSDMNITTDDGQDHDLNGWFAELGMETRVSGNVYLTVAGRYTDYNALNFTDEGPCNCNGVGDPDFYRETLELDHDTLAVMVGLKAKFGGF